MPDAAGDFADTQERGAAKFPMQLDKFFLLDTDASFL